MRRARWSRARAACSTAKSRAKTYRAAPRASAGAARLAGDAPFLRRRSVRQADDRRRKCPGERGAGLGTSVA
jgi:hypothetical protein